MKQVHITESDGQLAVASPYDTAFIERARPLGGRWDAAGKAWTFDARVQDEVRALCHEVYGEDGSGPTETVTVRVKLLQEVSASRASIRLLGRDIARAFGRDGGAKLGDGCVLESGKVDSGGSHKNWHTKADAGTTIRMYDVASSLVEAAGWDADIYEVTVIGHDAPNLNALRAERERLTARIAEIDAALSAAEDDAS